MNAINSWSKKLGQMVLTFVRNHKRILIEVFSVVAFFVFITLSINKCTYYKNVNDKNIIALTDSVKYYKGKYGNEVAKKTMVETDCKNLQNINDSLYRMIQSMQVKKPDIVIGGSTSIDNGKHDTVWVPTVTEITSKNIYRKFDFSNQYRELVGNVNYTNDTLGLHIEKDRIQFKYALAIKDNAVYMTSDNPYVKFNSITGLTIPKQKKEKKFGIGPSVFGGYSNKGFVYGVGIGLQYNLISFWKFLKIVLYLNRIKIEWIIMDKLTDMDKFLMLYFIFWWIVDIRFYPYFVKSLPSTDEFNLTNIFRKQYEKYLDV